MTLQKMNNNPIWKFAKQNWMLILAVVYFFSPLDFIPDLIPGVGFGDDILVMLATLFIRYRRFQRAEKETKEEVIEGKLAND